jgi:hypothetical protein
MAIDSNLAIFLGVLATRLLVPLAIPRFPLPAILASLVIDAVDQTVFQTFTTLDLAGYQGYDKALDIYYLSVAYLATMRNWTNLTAFEMSRFLYYYRLVGVLLFELSQVRALLLFFPNTFEYFFIFYEAVRLRWNPRRLTAAAVIGAAFAIWVFIKVPQEYWIHIAQLDVTDVIKLRLFGVPTDTSWGTIVASNIPFFIGLILAIIVLSAAIRQYIVTQLPPADWSLSFDADAHGRDVGPAEARAFQIEQARTLFDRDLLEKVVMIALVTTIFSRNLPGVAATPGQLAVWVAIIVVNTGVSELLVRRGFDWQSTIMEFVAMMAVNVAIVLAASSVLPSLGGAIAPGSSLFLLLLLTLLVILYDRFKPYYLMRRQRVLEEMPSRAA